MKRTKKWLAGLLCSVLLLGLLPTAALADESAGTADWAKDAVDTLNAIYGTTENPTVFEASNSVMTVSDLQTVLGKMGSTTSVTLEGTNLIRGKACEVLADIFALQVPAGKTAIQYLFEKNIISGKADGDLDADGTVTKAQFAVLTYRVLNFVGGGMGSSNTALKPGTKEYFAWMYLAARRCVDFNSGIINDAISSATITSFAGMGDAEYTDGKVVYKVNTAERSGEGIWNAWAAALSEPNIGGLEGFSNSLTSKSITYNGSETMIAAATRLMDAFIEAYTQAKSSAPTIFLDVTPDDWWYDGVMYSFDARYVSGLGNGTFEPEIRTPLYEFAVLLYRIDSTVDESALSNVDLKFLTNIDSSTEFTESEKTVLTNANVQKAMKAAVVKGYLSWADGQAENFDPTATVSRQDAIADILKACAAGKGIDLQLDSVNTGILERFTDASSIKDAAKPYLAYAVSHGMVSGTTGTTLSPTEPVMRAQAGVLLYRTLIGVDTTKMQDYQENVCNALNS